MNDKIWRAAGYIIVAVLAYITSILLPAILQSMLFFVSDGMGLSYNFLSDNPNMVYVFVALAEIVIFGTVFLLITRRDKKDRPPLMRAEKIGIITTAAFGISGISLIWLIAVEKVSSMIPALQKISESFNKNMDSINKGSYVWLIVAACVVGPVLEELIFRGVIFNLLKKTFRSPLPAILISGIAFGVWHGNLVQSVYAIITGIVLALVYEKTNDIKYPILIHVLNNALSALPSGTQNTSIPFIIDIICILMIIPAFIIIRHALFRKRAAESGI